MQQRKFIASFETQEFDLAERIITAENHEDALRKASIIADINWWNIIGIEETFKTEHY